MSLRCGSSICVRNAPCLSHRCNKNEEDGFLWSRACVLYRRVLPAHEFRPVLTCELVAIHARKLVRRSAMSSNRRDRKGGPPPEFGGLPLVSAISLWEAARPKDGDANGRPSAKR